MGFDTVDLTFIVLPHAATDANETPGEILGIVSVAAWHMAVKSGIVEQTQSQEWYGPGVIFRAPFPVLSAVSCKVQAIENPPASSLGPT